MNGRDSGVNKWSRRDNFTFNMNDEEIGGNERRYYCTPWNSQDD